MPVKLPEASPFAPIPIPRRRQEPVERAPIDYCKGKSAGFRYRRRSRRHGGGLSDGADTKTSGLLP